MAERKVIFSTKESENDSDVLASIINDFICKEGIRVTQIRRDLYFEGDEVIKEAEVYFHDERKEGHEEKNTVNCSADYPAAAGM